MTETEAATTWRESLRVYQDRRILTVLVLGFASGMPLLLTLSTLSVWLKESNVSKSTIGLFALVGVPYTFKFLWAPLIDRLRLPVLGRWLGRRRSWLVFTQVLLVAAILAMASFDPARQPMAIAVCALLVAFASASQDIVIDAYRVESLPLSRQGAGAGVLVLGYRLGMLASGAGALLLATAFGWNAAYVAMAALVLVGTAAALASPEPQTPVPAEAGRTGLGPWLATAVVAPLGEFLRRRGAAHILLFILLYKLGDTLAGVMANPFYLEMGFSKPEIASVSKVFGLIATLVGGLWGGLLVGRRGLGTSLLICGVLQMVSNLMFALQAAAGHDIRLLVATIGIENLASGMGSATFVAYMSSLCSVAYTATQYALLSSLMSFARTVLSAPGGWLAERLGWVAFFVFTTFAALPGLLLLLWLLHRFPMNERRATAQVG